MFQVYFGSIFPKIFIVLICHPLRTKYSFCGLKKQARLAPLKYNKYEKVQKYQYLR